MGTFLSRCAGNNPKLKRPSPGPSIAGLGNKDEEFTEYRHLRTNVIVYRRHLGTQITENPFEEQALNLVRNQNSEEGLLSSNGGSFSKPPADLVSRTCLHQLERPSADLCDIFSFDEVLIRDHEILWKILSATRQPWERLQQDTPGTASGFVQYQMRLLKTKKHLPFPSACRLPWPELYEASTDKLSSFVEMVNMCTESEIFELRIENDGQRGFTTNPRIAVMPRPPNGNGANRYRSRAILEGRRRTTLATSRFRNSSQTVQDVDLDGVIRTPTSDHIPR